MVPPFHGAAVDAILVKGERLGKLWQSLLLGLQSYLHRLIAIFLGLVRSPVLWRVESGLSVWHARLDLQLELPDVSSLITVLIILWRWTYLQHHPLAQFCKVLFTICL